MNIVNFGNTVCHSTSDSDSAVLRAVDDLLRALVSAESVGNTLLQATETQIHIAKGLITRLQQHHEITKLERRILESSEIAAGHLFRMQSLAKINIGALLDVGSTARMLSQLTCIKHHGNDVSGTNHFDLNERFDKCIGITTPDQELRRIRTDVQKLVGKANVTEMQIAKCIQRLQQGVEWLALDTHCLIRIIEALLIQLQVSSQLIELASCDRSDCPELLLALKQLSNEVDRLVSAGSIRHRVRYL